MALRHRRVFPGLPAAGPSPSPVVRLFSFLVPKVDVPIRLVLDSEEIALGAETGRAFDPASIKRPASPRRAGLSRDLVEVPLIRLAFARSGDKGDNANIGVLPRRAGLCAVDLGEADRGRSGAAVCALSQRARSSGSSCREQARSISCCTMCLAAGGVASLRNDPQAKGYSQILLQTPIPFPARWRSSSVDACCSSPASSRRRRASRRTAPTCCA